MFLSVVNRDKYTPILKQFMGMIEGLSLEEREALSPQDLKVILQTSKLPALVVSEEYGGANISLTELIPIIHIIG